MKKILIPLTIGALAGAGYVYYNSQKKPDIQIAPVVTETIQNTTQTDDATTISESETFPTAEQAILPLEDGKYTLSEGSLLEWRNDKTGGFDTGDIQVTADLNVTNGMLNGTFTIDMTTITLKDIESEKLLGEIKENIFSVSQYPTSTFTITNIQNTQEGLMVIGDLTIAGTTNTLSFTPTIEAVKDGFQFKAEFAIDRTLWGITAFENMTSKYIQYNFDLHARKIQ